MLSDYFHACVHGLYARKRSKDEGTAWVIDVQNFKPTIVIIQDFNDLLLLLAACWSCLSQVLLHDASQAFCHLAWAAGMFSKHTLTVCTFTQPCKAFVFVPLSMAFRQYRLAKLRSEYSA